jgi:hypothetical protein
MTVILYTVLFKSYMKQVHMFLMQFKKELILGFSHLPPLKLSETCDYDPFCKVNILGITKKSLH